MKGEIKRYNHLAENVADAVREKRQGTWHCIVGKSFGSFVTHEDKSLVYLSLGPVLVLVFRHG